ncbi:MAG: nucleotidyltransferase domain-containing protein [Candidatus Promineifilaceae bacterium]
MDWNDLAVRAIVLGLAPQLYARLRAWGTAAVPPRAWTKLKVSYQAQVARSAAIYAQLGEVLAAAAAAGLRPIALKGVHLTACYYAEPALRPMNDIDLLFEPGELAAAEKLLAGLGYAGHFKDPNLGPGVTKHTSTFSRPGSGEGASAPNPYLSAGAGRMVEPHTSLEESWFGLKVDITQGVRERAIPTALAGHPARVLCAEDLLLHTCVHFCFHFIMGAPGLVQLGDVLAITAANEGGAPPLNWPAFGRRAVARGAAPYALACLRLAQSLLGAPAPAETLALLARATPRRLWRHITGLDLAQLLARSQRPPLTGLGQRVGRGLSDRREAARWAADWPGRWRVWQTAFNPLRTDTGRLLLKRPLKTAGRQGLEAAADRGRAGT